MNKLIGDEQPLNVGRTEVLVKRRDIDEYTRKETITTIHKGVIIQRVGDFVRVFNHAPVSKGGDTSPANAELFPIDSDRCWIEVDYQRKPEFAMAQPWELRY